MKPATIDEIDEAIFAYQTVLANDLTDNAVKAWIENPYQYGCSSPRSFKVR